MRFYTNLEAKRHEAKCKRKPNSTGRVKLEGNPESENSGDEGRNEMDEIEDVEEAEEITYTSYRPAKFKYGKDHPGECVFHC